MRACVLVCVTTLCGLAAAGEVVLEPKDVVDDPRIALPAVVFRVMRSDPRVEKAPEGDPVFFTLRAGKKKYTLAAVKEDGAFAKLYVDRDGDGDLAEEEPCGPIGPAGVEKNCFKVKVDAELTVGGKPFTFPATLFVSPAETSVKAATALVGVYKTKAGEFDVVWLGAGRPAVVPHGFEKHLGLLTSYCMRASEQYVGRRRFSVGAPLLKDGRPVVALSSENVESMKEVKVPDGSVFFLLYVRKGRRFSQSPYVVVGGKAFLPAGTYVYALLFLARTSGKDVWHLGVQVRDFKVADGTDFGAVEPLKLSSTVGKAGGGKLSILAELRDASGRGVLIAKNMTQIDAPTLEITDADGKTVHTYKYHYG